MRWRPLRASVVFGPPHRITRQSLDPVRSRTQLSPVLHAPSRGQAGAASGPSCGHENTGAAMSDPLAASVGEAFSEDPHLPS
jgi:hypothetical protein